MEHNCDLSKAMQARDLTKMILSIKRGANVDHKTEEGDTPLSIAVQKGCISSVSTLLDLGARDLDKAKEYAKANEDDDVIKIINEAEKNRKDMFADMSLYFDMVTGLGIFGSCKTPIFVIFLKRNQRQLNLSRRVNHVGFLESYYENKDMRVLRRFDMKLSSYLEQSKQFPFAKYVIPNESRDEYHYLVDFYRVMFSTMLDFIHYLHKLKISIDFSGFDMDNICVIENCIKFYGILFIDADNESVKRDHMNLVSLMKTIINSVEAKRPGVEHEEKVVYPPLLNDFFRLLNMASQSSSLMKYHLAILSMKDMNRFLHNVSGLNRYRSRVTEQVNKAIIDKMTLSSENRDDWTTRFTGINNSGPMVHCFEEGKKKGAIYKDKDGGIWLKKKRLLTYCRNLAEHLCESPFPCGLKPSMEEVHHNILFYFGRELLSFQVHANTQGVLECYVET